MIDMRDIISIHDNSIRRRIAISSMLFLVIFSLIGTVMLVMRSGGDIKAASGDVILLWDGEAIPSGWECLSCSATGTFFGVFPRGSSTYGAATTSQDTFSHAVSFATHTAGATAGQNQAGVINSAGAHFHGATVNSVGAGDIRPPFKNLKFIRASGPLQLPNGAIGMFDVSSSSLPASWSYYSAAAGNYLRGENGSSTGGASEHSHAVNASATAAAQTAGSAQTGGTLISVAQPTHVHAIAGTSPVASNTPPFINVVFAKLTTTSTMPVGLIAMFDAAAPANWTSISGAGSDLNGRFPRGSDAYGAIGGSATHIHATTTIVSGASTVNTNRRSGVTSVIATGAHAHNFSFTAASTSSLPVYRDVVFAKFDGAPILTQVHYHWRNDDDNEANASAAEAEDQPLSDMQYGVIYRLRFEVSNEGTATSSATAFRLEFATNSGGPWAAVPTSTDQAFVMASTSQLVDAASTTNISTSTGGTTDENSAFLAGQQKESGNQAGAVSLSTTQFTELEYAIKATPNATSGQTYWFRVSDAGAALTSYAILASSTVGAVRFITVAATGTQVATTTAPSNDFYTGGAFTFIRNLDHATATQIIITASGTIDADTHLSNIRLYYEPAATCSFQGNETLFGSATSFSSGKATIAGSMGVATSQICLYAVLNVGSSTPAGATVDIEIEDPSTEVTVSQGTVQPSTIESIGGLTTIERRVMTVSSTGSQTATTSIPSTNFYVGGAFTFIRDGGTATVTQMIVMASGTVDEAADLGDVDVYYEATSTCSFQGDEAQFGSAPGFSAAGKATTTGEMAVGIGQTCVYIVLDVGAGASDGETLEMLIQNPSTEILATEGDVTPATPVNISGTTTLEVLPGITVGVDGQQVASTTVPSANFFVGGAFTFTRNAGSANITQIIISDTGSVTSTNNLSNLDLYYETTSTCSFSGSETLFGTAVNFVASGTREIATVTGTMAVGVSQVCLYAVLDAGIGALDDETIELEITNPSLDVAASAGQVNPASAVALPGVTTLDGPAIVLGSAGAQTATTTIPSNNFYAGGAYTMRHNVSSSTVTSITIHASGTINADADLSNLDIYYETAATCTYNGTEALFGTAASFTASHKAAVSGSLSVATSQVCFYIVVDVNDSAADAATIEISIQSPATEIVLSQHEVEPADTREIAGTTTLAQLAITYTQRNYRFYANIDSAAPTTPLAAENATTTGIVSGSSTRLRVNIRVTDASLATSTQAFRLQYAEKGGFSTCGDVPSGNFSHVGNIASSTPWRGFSLGSSATDGASASTTLLSSSTVAESYEEENPSVTNPQKIPAGGVGEWDWVLYDNAAKPGTNYCFRMALSSGAALDGYTNIPELRTQVSASWMAAENAATSTQRNANFRLRIEISNEGNISDSAQLRLEYATSTGGPWTNIPYDEACSATSTHFRMCNSSNYVDGDPTTNRLTAEAATFVTGTMIESSTPAASVTLATDQFTEYEWTLQATTAAAAGTTYYFRATDNGVAVGTYSVYPQLTLVSTALTQNYYRWYVDNNQIDPTDPWPPGGTDLGENAAITASFNPPGIGETIRIRMTVQVSAAAMPAGEQSFKLQFADRGGGSCSAVGEPSWFDVGAPASSTIWRGYNGSSTDGVSVTALRISIADATGTYEEQNNSAVNPSAVAIGDDIEYDWVLQNNNATSGAAYCFRMKRDNDTPLDGYNNYPTLVTETFAPASANWQWYNDEGSETPAVPLDGAGENIAPANVVNNNIIKLRMTIRDIGGGAGTNVKFRIQFSEYPDFSQSVIDAVEQGSCQGNSLWCYGNGVDADDDPITTRVLTDSNANGRHNETGSSTSTFDPGANARTEFEFTLRHAGARANAVYYFRAFDHTNGQAVPLYATSTYPSLSTEGAQLAFTISGLSAGTTTEGVTTDITTTANGVPFGSLAFGSETEAAQRLQISTNATEGYQVIMYQRQGLLESGGSEIAPVGATNEIPAAWTSGCAATSAGCYGYHAGDDVLSGGSSRFAANDTYARFETSTKEIAYNPVSAASDTIDVVYKLQVDDEQPAGDYQSSVVYIVVPVF